MFAIKVHLADPAAVAFAFDGQKTMYGGKLIAKGDEIFIFDSENAGGSGLVALQGRQRLHPRPHQLCPLAAKA